MERKKREELQWSIPYPQNIAGSIMTNSALRQFTFSPDFNSAVPPHAVGPGQVLFAAPVVITMSGTYRADFNKANQGANILQKPRGYTWHHVYSPGGLIWVPNGYQCAMQLVQSNIHRRTCPHQGAVAQWVAATGSKYKSVFEEDIPCTFRKNAHPFEKNENLKDVPPVIAELTKLGYLGGDAVFSFRFGNEGQYAIEVCDTYGVLSREEMQEYKKADNVVKEMNKLGAYPVGEDQAGNLVFYHEAAGDLWIYDHEHVLDPEDKTGQVMYPTGVTFEDIFSE